MILTEQNGQLYGVTPLTLEGAQMLLPQGQLLNITLSSSSLL